MSNQQPYGQPQYGPQFGGYPPPPPPRKSKAGLIVFCLVVALVVIGSGIFVVSRFSGGSDDTAGGASTPVAVQPATQAPTQPPSPGGSPSAPPSRPASPSAPPPAPCNGCFPGITVNGALRQLKAKGFACKEDRVLGIECVKGKLEVGIDRDYTLKNYIENIDVGGRAGGKGDYPQGPREAFATLNAGLPGVLPIFIADASIRQQIVAFTARNAGHADNGPSTVRDGKAGNYRLSCHGVSGATVGKDGKSASSYSTSVNIYGPSAY